SSKSDGVDTAKITVRSVLDELFDRAYRLRLRRFSQSIEESVGFTGKFHVAIRLITVVLPCAGENGKQATDAPNLSLRRCPLRLRVSCSGTRVACVENCSRHGCLYRNCRFNAVRSRRGERSTLVDEKRTRFLKHFVEFFGGHFSD